jgi:uncharacterized OB-fold protein
MEAAKCKGCGKVDFPPRLICSQCKGREFETVVLPREATLISWTVQHVAPSDFTDETPYVVGIIGFKDGPAMTAQVVDCDPEKLKIGQQVHIEFRKVKEDGAAGVICYGYKGVPA